jgi:hypothetical protein
MSGRHTLAGRSELELLWMQRRSFMQAACTWTAIGGFTGAQAQQRSNIVELTGDALLNGPRLPPGHTIQSGDAIMTGPGSNLIFVLGNSSFQVRQNSHLVVERAASLSAVSVLRLLTGAVVSVWGKGPSAASSPRPSRSAYAAPAPTPRCSPHRTFAAIFVTAMAPWR